MEWNSIRGRFFVSNKISVQNNSVIHLGASARTIIGCHARLHSLYGDGVGADVWLLACRGRRP